MYHDFEKLLESKKANSLHFMLQVLFYEWPRDCNPRLVEEESIQWPYLFGL